MTMAENVSPAGGRRRRDSGGELPDHNPADGAAPAKAASNIATEADAQRAFSIYSNAEKTYDAFLAQQRADKSGAKSIRDKALADSVVICASRGMTKKGMRAMYEKSLLDPEQLQAEVKSEVWMMRAIGLPIGTQLAFFEETFGGNDELLRKAYQKGRDAFVEKKGTGDNPFHPSGAPGQEWLRGLADAGDDVIRNMANNKAN